jgi:deoxyribonuclease IV
MPRFGAHLSMAGGFDRAVVRAREIKADCLQVFLKSPTQWRFEPLRYLLESSREPRRLGVTLDTCHLFVAGYDLRTAAAIEETLGRLDETVGLSRVFAVHANDAKGGRGSHLDRHEHIGRGRLGREAFHRLVNHPALAAPPFILETPKQDPRGREMDPVNLRALRRMVRST